MHKMRCLLINRRSLLRALRLLRKTPIFPSNSRFPRLCAKCLLKLKRLVSILPMFFFSSRRRHTMCGRDWSSDVCSSDLILSGGKSKTGVPSTYVRFDFPPLRIVAIRTEALNFSVTMSRRTERFARKGLYLTVCRWMFRSMTPRARVSSSVRASRTSRARGGRESASNRLCSVPRIRGFHDCRNDRDTRDSVPREEGRVRRVHPTDCEHGQRRASDDRIQDVHW